jgi:excisionase family DNA binding protein
MTLLDKVADDALLTPAEVAALFRVSPKTVARWESAGKLRAVKTLGGHRRFHVADVRAALAGAGPQG